MILKQIKKDFIELSVGAKIKLFILIGINLVAGNIAQVFITPVFIGIGVFFMIITVIIAHTIVYNDKEERRIHCCIKGS